MKRYFCFWEVDGASGCSETTAASEAEAKEWFRLRFARFGYKLIRVSLTY